MTPLQHVDDALAGQQIGCNTGGVLPLESDPAPADVRAVSLTNPEMALSVVLLPAPLAPSSATMSPCPTRRETPATARIAPS